MKKKISKKLKMNRILSIIVLIFGLVLLTYMIVIESEPGALPLFMLITGAIWFAINQMNIKKYHRENKR